MAKKKILLSADGDVSLYEVEPEILEHWGSYISQFEKWRHKKCIRCYDETLFVGYLRKQLGEDTILFCQKMDFVYVDSDPVVRSAYPKDYPPEEYRDIMWFNF